MHFPPLALGKMISLTVLSAFVNALAAPDEAPFFGCGRLAPQPSRSTGIRRTAHSISIRSILKMTGRVPSEQHAIMVFSAFIHPRMMEPPCKPA